jgi:hypothetical protein
LREPRFGLAVLLGAVAGTPGAPMSPALHQLVTGKASTAVQAAAVAVFVLIKFSLVIIPFVFLQVIPEGAGRVKGGDVPFLFRFPAVSRHAGSRAGVKGGAPGWTNDP